MGEGPVTYEVALTPDPAILREFDLWLEGHVAEMLRLPGFDSASIHPAEEPGTGRPERVVRYRLESREALERYFREDAARMRADGVQRFGDRFSASRRIVEEGHQADSGPPRPCANCGTPLHGQYCSDCGQRSRVRMITFWELVRDAGDLLASLDSRLWRTLGLLLFRPGRLTLDYLQGRRARYVAPLRLFIASSLIFFFVAALNTSFEAGEDGAVIRFSSSGQEAGETEDPEAAPGEAGAEDGPLANVREDALEGLTDAQRAEAEQALRDAEEALKAAAGAETGSAEAPSDKTPEEVCAEVELGDLEDSWAGKYLTEERAREVCEKIAADHGAGFGRALFSNLPTMMFLFLPLMALVMKGLYPLSGRYYAEHLLFLVHYHAFFYFASTLITLGWVASDLPAIGETPANVVTAVLSIYLPVYLFRAMRRVYGQGFWGTLFKYALLGVAYFSALTATFVILVTYTALTL